MTILFIIKMKILMLILWSYRPLPIMLTIEHRMITYFKHAVQIPFEKHVFLVSILGATANHIQRKNGCPDKRSNRIRIVYLMCQVKHKNIPV